MANENQMQYLGLGAAQFVLLGVLFYLSGIWPHAMPLSIEAFSQPFQGDYAMLAIILSVLLVMDLAYYLSVFIPQFLPDAKNHLILLAFPEIASVFGLIIGLLNQNLWGALPFFVLGIMWYAYAYMKVAQAAK